MSRKRIVHIISSLKRGGAESLLVDLIRNIKDFEHIVVCFHDGPNRERLIAMGVKVHVVQGLVCLYDCWFWIRLWRLIKNLKPNVLHSGLWAANFSARIIAYWLKIPLISVVHLAVDQDGRIRNSIDKLTFACSQRIVAVSDQVAHSIIDKQWVPSANITVVKNGVAIDMVHQEAYSNCVTRKDLNIPDYAFVIGSVGRFIPRKNYHMLLKSFSLFAKSNETSYLMLVGFGPLEQDLRLYAQSLGIVPRVRFIVGQAAYGYYPLFSCFALPSLQEGISIALLEAMSFGLPCIVAATGRCHEVIEHGKNGFLVEPNDTQVLKQTLAQLMENPSIYRGIGRCAHETIKNNYSINGMTRAYRQLFKDSIRN